jgi:undecaprenyl-diphosphatase
VTALYAALLGIIQGLTEFLPVSSSAHLILARAFFGWNAPEFGLAFDVALHLGTLLAIALYFRVELTAMALALPSALSPAPDLPARLVRLVAIGTLPAIAVGLLFNDYIEHVLRTPAVAAVALAVGAVALLAAERLGARRRQEQDLTWIDALLIGVAQASALVPGVSRSGATIAIAMFLGVRRDAAARFTFLLAVPAILAAGGKEALALRDAGLTPELGLAVLTGGLCAAIVGYLTIKYFLKFLAGNRLDVFAYYRLALAAATVVWLLAQGPVKE